MIRWITLASLAVGSACSVKSVGDLETEGMSGTESGGEAGPSSTASASASDSSASSNPSSDSITSVGEDTSVGDDDSGSTSGEDSATTGEDCSEQSVCDPQPTQQNASFMIDGMGVGEGNDSELLDVPCTISAVEGEDPTHIELDCMEDGPTTHTIDVALHDTSFFNIYEGRAVVFDWIVIAPFWTEDYFTLRSEQGNLILAGGRGSVVVPQPDFYAPLAPELRSGVCELEQPCEGKDFIDPEACSIDERTAIEFHHGELVSEVVLDGTSAMITNGNTMWVRVQESVTRHEISCTDIPMYWHEWLVEDISEG